MFNRLKSWVSSIIDKIKMWIRLRMICDALEIKLYPQVKRFVLNNDDSILHMGKSSGKTTAILLRALVNRDVPRNITNAVAVITFIDDPDLIKTPVKRYAEMLIDAVFICESSGIDVTRD